MSPSTDDPSDGWRRIDELFHRVADAPPAEREALLAAAEPRIAAEVRSLLEVDSDAGRRVDALAEVLVSNAVARLPPRARGGPETIGPYRVLRELGHGGFGTVYLAERLDDGFRLEVAVKLVHAGYGPLDLDRRLRLERSILARLEHPNIARLLDGGTADDGRPYLVMERVDGEPIDRYCDRHGLGVAERVRLVRDVCAAVAHAHRALVIHRDLKPSNVLVTADGTVKLLDFGIAKLIEDDLEGGLQSTVDLQLTRTGQLPFTPDYASPEQVRGEALGTATDVYSLGALLYRLLTGRPPLRLDEPRTPARLERLVCQTPPAPASHVVDDPARARALRGDLDTILSVALRKEPSRRYGSVAQLADDLERHLESRPVEAVGDAWSYRLGRFVKRHRLAVGAAALVALALAGGVVSTMLQARRAERHQARTEQVMDLLLDDVFGSAAPERARGDPPSAREILDRSAGDLDRRLVGSPDLHGTLLIAMGRLYQQLGVYDRSFVYLQRGTDRLRAVHGVDDPEVLSATSALGDVMTDLGRRRAARQILHETAERQRRIDGAERELSATLHRQALVDEALGDLDAAQAALDEALRLRRVSDRPLALADTLAVRAKLDYRRGDLDVADVRVREALAIRREAHGADHPDTLVSLNDLAVIVQARGDLEAAEALFRDVVAVNERIHGSEHRNLANALVNLGWVEARRGRAADAASTLERAVAIYREVLGDDHPLLANARRKLARASMELGGFSRAGALLEENLDRCRRTEGEASLCFARSLYDLGGLELERGDAESALRRFEIAQERFEELLPADDWRRMLPLYERGRALAALGRVEEARTILRRAHEGFAARLGPGAEQTLRALSALEKLSSGDRSPSRR